jgi:hypothetical protein
VSDATPSPADSLHAIVRPDDVGSIDAVVRAVYEAVSFTDCRGPTGGAWRPVRGRTRG